MKIKLIISALSLIGNLYAADFSDQVAFNRFYAQTVLSTYEKINANVTFSEITGTRSDCWDARMILQRTFLVKKRGIPLSHAINDLITPESMSSFECATAQLITQWTALIPFGIDGIINKFEEADESFFLPLMSAGIYNIIVDYVENNQLYLHQMLGRPYTIKGVSLDLRKELTTFEELGNVQGKLFCYLSCFSDSPQNGTLPCKTVEGGVLYLPNVAGVGGAGQGENLFCVNAEDGLYYGFGELFKTGPKTLLEIGNSLVTYANERHPGLYVRAIMPHLKGLREQGRIEGKVPEGYHPLQYLINAETCVYFDLAKTKEVFESSK